MELNYCLVALKISKRNYITQKQHQWVAFLKQQIFIEKMLIIIVLMLCKPMP